MQGGGSFNADVSLDGSVCSSSTYPAQLRAGHWADAGGAEPSHCHRGWPSPAPVLCSPVELPFLLLVASFRNGPRSGAGEGTARLP